MRNSSLLKWATNNKNNKLASSKTKDEKGNNKNWIHNPETLKTGHVAYLVKFLGCTEVDKPKGIDVVKQGIQKLKFNQQLKKSEGSKTPKVELTISIEGVAIQEPKTKKILHQYPLHKISYCADDKAEKRFFSFISKDGEGKHTCFVFVSDKLAEEITLTIGQAFELAYKKYLDTSGKELETQKQMLTLQKRVELLENENSQLKSRLREVAKIKGDRDIQEYLANNKLGDICQLTVTDPSGKTQQDDEINGKEAASSDDDKPANAEVDESKQKSDNNELICLDMGGIGNVIDEKLDSFTLDDLNDDDFNPRGSDDDDLDFNPRKSTAENLPPSTSAPFSANLFPPPSKSSPVQSAPLIEPSLTLPPLPPRDVAKVSSPTATQLFNNNDKFHSDASLGSGTFQTNPFETPTAADPFGMTLFDNQAAPFSKPFPNDDWGMVQKSIAVNSLSLDELDPLKK